MMREKKREVSLPTKTQVETERKRYRRQKAYNKALRGTVYVLTIVAAVAVLVATLILPVLQIEGTSMEPTLCNGDIVLLAKTPRFNRGDLCGFTWNNKLLVKRVIGLPGDWIEIDSEGNVYVNGNILEEPYVQWKALGECLPFLTHGARWIMIAALAGTKTEIDLKNIYVRNVRIVGSTLRSRTPDTKAFILRELVQNVWPKIEQGAVMPTIYRVLPITEAEEAHSILERGENVGKVVLKVR